MKLKIVATVVACTTVVVCSYWYIYHSHRYNGLSSNAKALIVIVPMSLLYILWIEPLFRTRILKWLCAMISLALAFSGWAMLSSFRDQRLAKQRAQDGVAGYGLVTDFELEHRKGGPITYAIFEYQYLGRIYKQKVLAQPSTHFHETLRLHYSSSDPENAVVTAYDVKAANRD